MSARSEDWLAKAFLDGAPVIASIRDRGGAAVYANRSFVEVFAPSGLEAVSTRRDLISEDAAALLLQGGDLVQSTGERWSAEIEAPGPSGSERTYRVEKFPVLDDAGEIVAVASLWTDLTESKRIEAELVEARDEARHANDAKDEFLGRMSHELRTPLNAILGFGQLLERAGLQPRHQEWVGNVVSAGRLLLSLVNEILDLAQVASGKLQLSLEPVDVSGLVDDVLGMVAPLAAARQITIVNELDETSGITVRGDRRRLGQILLNLLTNAVKYSNSGGHVRILSERQGDQVRILVTDDGPGIAPEDQERLFLAFDRLGAETTSVEGSGLGLAVAKALAEAQGGEVGVESRLGEGSSFWVALPAATAPRRPDADATRTQREPDRVDRPMRTVLYIEDNPVNVDLVESILTEHANVSLLVARNGATGLEMASAHVPALILLDLHLPDIQGEKVLAALRANPQTASIPVVVLSADANPKDIARLLAQGADEYVSKPFVIEDLLAAYDRLTEDSPGASAADPRR